MLFGCVCFKGLFLRCHGPKMPKGIFSLKNHLWAKPNCGVMDPEDFLSSYKRLKAGPDDGNWVFPFASNLSRCKVSLTLVEFRLKVSLIFPCAWEGRES